MSKRTFRPFRTKALFRKGRLRKGEVRKTYRPPPPPGVRKRATMNKDELWVAFHLVEYPYKTYIETTQIPRAEPRKLIKTIPQLMDFLKREKTRDRSGLRQRWLTFHIGSGKIAVIGRKYDTREIARYLDI